MLPILERKSGRILANGFPTGVEVTDTIRGWRPLPRMHQFRRTSVGTTANRRWLRPVYYQNRLHVIIPEDLL